MSVATELPRDPIANPSSPVNAIYEESTLNSLSGTAWKDVNGNPISECSPCALLRIH